MKQELASLQSMLNGAVPELHLTSGMTGLMTSIIRNLMDVAAGGCVPLGDVKILPWQLMYGAEVLGR